MSKRKLIAASLVAFALLLAAGWGAVWAFPLRSPALAPQADPAVDHLSTEKPTVRRVLTVATPADNGGANGTLYEYQGKPYQYGEATAGVRTVTPIPIYDPDAPYTQKARDARVQGDLILSILVGKDGQVKRVKEIGKHLGYGLDKSAIKTVRTWTFKPGKRDGEPAAVTMRVEVTFRFLPDDASASSPLTQAEAEGRIVRSIYISGFFVPFTTIQERMRALGFGIMQPYDQQKADRVKTAIQELHAERGIAVGVDERVTAVSPGFLAVHFIVYRHN